LIVKLITDEKNRLTEFVVETEFLRSRAGKAEELVCLFQALVRASRSDPGVRIVCGEPARGRPRLDSEGPIIDLRDLTSNRQEQGCANGSRSSPLDVGCPLLSFSKSSGPIHRRLAIRINKAMCDLAVESRILPTCVLFLSVPLLAVLPAVRGCAKLILDFPTQCS
jgi:hypothetical protein